MTWCPYLSIRGIRINANSIDIILYDTFFHELAQNFNSFSGYDPQHNEPSIPGRDRFERQASRHILLLVVIRQVNLFSDDGRILLHDGREVNTMTRAQCTLQNSCEFTDVKYHPFSDQLFATSDGRGQVCLRDARMAFGPLVSRTREGVVRVVSHGSSYHSERSLNCHSTIRNCLSGESAT